jgi:hypothetical protein
MAVTYSSEVLVELQQATWCYIPEDGTLHNYRCESLNSYVREVNPPKSRLIGGDVIRMD